MYCIYNTSSMLLKQYCISLMYYYDFVERRYWHLRRNRSPECVKLFYYPTLLLKFKWYDNEKKPVCVYDFIKFCGNMLTCTALLPPWPPPRS